MITKDDDIDFDDGAAQATPKLASPASLKYMRDLATSRDTAEFLANLPGPWVLVYNKALTSEDIAQTDVSKFIDVLKRLDRRPAAKSMGGRPEIEDGLYVVGLNDNGTINATTSIYKVQHAVHGSGHQYAKRLHVEYDEQGAPTKAVFRMESGAINKIRPENKMDMATAAIFGKLYGVCCVCGKLLTNEVSIRLGIGPICGGRQFGAEFNELHAAAALLGRRGM